MTKNHYHYSTWFGDAVFYTGTVEPRVNYVGFGLPLVFATLNPHWEPSIQAAWKVGHYEKCGSCPELYEQLDIPCWRFLVRMLDPVSFIQVLFDMGPGKHTNFYAEMIADAAKMGSDVFDWTVSRHPALVLETARWVKGEWHVVG